MIAFGAELPIALLSMFGWICPISDLRADGFERLIRVEAVIGCFLRWSAEVAGNGGQQCGARVVKVPSGVWLELKVA
jgi:hypothetical protein